jgi:hypothetical protein
VNEPDRRARSTELIKQLCTVGRQRPVVAASRQRKVERAMGIEPTRAATPKLENKRFGATTNPKCDWRVNFRGMWGHAGLRRDTSVGATPGWGPPVMGL